MNLSIKKHLLLAIALCLAVFSNAQRVNNTLYNMKNLPQSTNVNPAFRPDAKVFVGFPALSSIYFNYSNSAFSYQDVITNGTGLQSDSLVIDVNSFHKALNLHNTINTQFEISLFALGIRAKSLYFTLDFTEKQDFRLGFDKEMITFIKNGNANFRGRTSNWGGIDIDATAYHEIALGVSKEINKKLTVGFKAKMLFGIGNVYMEESDITVKTSVSGDKITLRSVQKLNTSFPIDTISYNSEGYYKDMYVNDDDFREDFFSNTGNKGFAIDLGADYKLNDRIRVFASILDIGAINWKTDTRQFTQDAEFEYSGADLSQSGNSNATDFVEIEDSFDNIFDDLKDSLLISTGNSSYVRSLPTKIYIGGSYDLSSKVNVAALFRNEVYNSKLRSSFSLSANAQFFKNLSTSVSYSIVNNTYTNIGFGLATKLGPFQLYAISDNIMAAIDPNSAQLANIRVGLNLLFGCKEKRARYKDSCSFEDRSYKKRRR